MRPAIGVLVVLMVVLAGCSLPSDGTTTSPGMDPTVSDRPTTPTDTLTTQTPSSPTPTVSENVSEMVETLPDPESDRLGWEAGLWYNETIDVNNSDGMDARERRLAVARAMARVEHVRQLEFPGNETIPTEVISREEFKQRQSERSNYSEAFRTFDNVKFEALLFVGEDRDSLAVQESNLGSSVLGYYSPANNSIVLISEGDLPQFDGEETLAQEVAHALQDQQFNLTRLQQGAGTRDRYAGHLGVIEGDGNLIDELYVSECGGHWSCIPSPPGGSEPTLPEDFHYGIYFMEFLPYSDGPGFIRHHYDRGGWDAIDAMYADPPQSSEQVIVPEKYSTDPPVDVSLSDRTSGAWERVQPDPQSAQATRPDYDTLGMGALSSMFMYTGYTEYNSSALVTPLQFINYENGALNTSDPLDYGFEYTDGWEGDRLHVYRNADTGADGYVWRLVWESPTDAREFADAYERLLSFWGGERVSETRWVVAEDSPFADAFSVQVEGDTVTIVNAPTTGELGAVFEPAS